MAPPTSPSTQKTGLSHDRARPPVRPALELTDIELHYGFVRALDGIDLHVMPGEVVALLGDNGAGKSTLLKVMSGAHKPSARHASGCTAWSDSFHAPSDAAEAGIQMVYQDLALVEPQDISTNLNIGQEILRSGPLGLAGLRRPQGDAQAAPRPSSTGSASAPPR